MTCLDLTNPGDQADALETVASAYALYPEIARLLAETADQIKAANEWQSELFESV